MTDGISNDGNTSVSNCSFYNPMLYRGKPWPAGSRGGAGETVVYPGWEGGTYTGRSTSSPMYPGIYTREDTHLLPTMGGIYLCSSLYTLTRGQGALFASLSTSHTGAGSTLRLVIPHSPKEGSTLRPSFLSSKEPRSLF